MDPKFVIIYNSGTLAITLDPQMELLHRYPFFSFIQRNTHKPPNKKLKKKKKDILWATLVDTECVSLQLTFHAPGLSHSSRSLLGDVGSRDEISVRDLAFSDTTELSKADRQARNFNFLINVKYSMC